jgi:hypothetical protein
VGDAVIWLLFWMSDDLGRLIVGLLILFSIIELVFRAKDWLT